MPIWAEHGGTDAAQQFDHPGPEPEAADRPQGHPKPLATIKLYAGLCWVLVGVFACGFSPEVVI
jgi:hypothetical protein